MNMKRMASSIFVAARKACGLALALAACAGVALADGPPPPAPEIDPASAVTALSLLVGGVLMVTDKLRRR